MEASLDCNLEGKPYLVVAKDILPFTAVGIILVEASYLADPEVGTPSIVKEDSP